MKPSKEKVLKCVPKYPRRETALNISVRLECTKKEVLAVLQELAKDGNVQRDGMWEWSRVGRS